MQTFFYNPILTLSIFCSPFLRQMLCERHNVTVAPGSKMWIHLTMQFKDIHRKWGAMTSTWDIVVILPCQKCQWRHVRYFSHSCIYFSLFIYLSTFEFIFLLKRKKMSCKLLTSWYILDILTNPFYFLIALFFKSIIYKSYSSFVMFRCFKPAVSLLRHWCRKCACSAKRLGIRRFVSGCLLCVSPFPRVLS